VEVPPTGPWEKAGGNPIRPIDDPNPEPGLSLLAENIVYDNDSGHYWMVFANYRLGSSNPTVGLVWSDDPGNPDSWHWHGDILTQANAPHLIEHDGTWYLFYADRSVPSPYPISFATSNVISGPYTTQGQILTPTQPWESYRVDQPFVFQRNDGVWVLMYMGDKGFADNPQEQVGYALADDISGPYAKYTDNPVLDFGPPGTYDAGTVANPWVVELNGTYYIGYTAGLMNTSPWQTGYATTTDWQTFTKHGLTLPLGLPGAWDEANAFRGAVSRFGDTYYFPYTGHDNLSPLLHTSYWMGITIGPVIKPLGNPDLVFDFYDSFEGESLSTKWTVEFQGDGHTIAVNNGTLTLTASNDGDFGYVQMCGLPALGKGSLIEAYASHPDAGLDSGQWTNTAGEIGFKGADFNNIIRLMDFPNVISYTMQSSADGNSSLYIDMNTPFDTGWHMFTISRTTDGQAGFRVDDGIPEYINSPQNIPSIDMHPLLMSYARLPAPQSRFVVDWVRARKWCGSPTSINIKPEQIILDLEITQISSGDVITAEFELLTYTLDITNTGFSMAPKVQVTDTLPVEASIITVTSSSGTCTVTNPMTCNLGDVTQSEHISITMVVTASAHGPITNTAQVGTVGDEPVLENNTSKLTTNVIDTISPQTGFTLPVPTEGTYFTSGEIVTLVATATDNVAIDRVFFWRWDHVNEMWIEIGNDDTFPYAIDFNTAFLQPEWNQLYVEAFDKAGNSSSRLNRILIYRSPLLYHYLSMITRPNLPPDD
jgi:uncharacterized repeat protein (TIGR01451 family)